MDKEWHRLMLNALENGERRHDRTGVGTLATFGEMARFDLREGFPACTTKRLAFSQVRAELACFLRGAQSLNEFHSMGCTLWDANASAQSWLQRAAFPGDVGRIYGVQWRRWRSWREASWVKASPRGGVPHPDNVVSDETDQMKALVDGMKAQPHGRRHVVSGWNAGELDQMCLPPCHVMFQCFCSDEQSVVNPWGATGGHLDLHFHMRSLDLFLGMPFDVASYALLCHLLAREVERTPRYLVMTVGDAHVYLNHQDAARLAMDRDAMRLPLLLLYARPRLKPYDGLLDFLPTDAELQGYASHPAIKAEMAV